MSQKPAGAKLPWILAIGGLVAGIILRASMVFVFHTPSEHVFSDSAGYVAMANRLLESNASLTGYDFIQPIGTGLLLASIMRVTGGLDAANFTWFLMSSAIPFFWFFTARKLGGIRVAAAVAWLTALDVGSASYGAIFMSETPFGFLVAAGAACLAHAFRAHGAESRRFAVAAGTIWGTSLLFRGHAMAILFMLGSCCAYLTLTGRRGHMLFKALIPCAFVALSLSAYFSVKVGRPMTTSLGMACQTLMGRLPDAAETRFEVPGKGIVHFYGSPAVHQRCPTRKYVFPFAVIDNGAAMAEVLRRLRNAPTEVLSLSLRNANDTITGNDPWPPNQMPTLNWLRIYESFFAVFVLIPACALVLPPYPRDRRMLEIATMALPVAGIWLIGLLTIGETRYRVPFDGMIIIMACMKWGEVLASWGKIRSFGLRPQDDAPSF